MVRNLRTTDRVRARNAVAVLASAYGSFGFFWGTFVVIFADFLRARHLSPGQASLQLSALSVASIVVMTFGAPRLEALPKRAPIALALLIHAGGAVLIGLAPTGVLVACFTFTGLGPGLTDVFVNSA